jgi:aminoglycoside phosphotransferase (APT) family kinase protein
MRLALLDRAVGPGNDSHPNLFDVSAQRLAPFECRRLLEQLVAEAVNTVAMKSSGVEGLLKILVRESGVEGLQYREAPRALIGGYWADLFTFSLQVPPPGWPAQLVARYMPEPAVGRKEALVQAAAAAAGYPTPQVRATDATADGQGISLMVMDLAPGAPLLSGISGVGALRAALRSMRRLPGLLALAMADLHALDPRLVDHLLDVADVPVTTDQLLSSLIEMATSASRPDLASAANWLLNHRPAQIDRVICHGDLHPLNILVDTAGFTVVDWSGALLGPRAFDLAYTSLLLAEPPLVVPRPAQWLVRALGARLARRFVAEYERQSGVNVVADQMRWHEGLVCQRALVEVATWQHRGQLDNRAGHPWITSGPAYTQRLRALTGVPINWL